jgi:hypothetical protein
MQDPIGRLQQNDASCSTTQDIPLMYECAHDTGLVVGCAMAGHPSLTTSTAPPSWDAARALPHNRCDNTGCVQCCTTPQQNPSSSHDNSQACCHTLLLLLLLLLLQHCQRSHRGGNPLCTAWEVLQHHIFEPTLHPSTKFIPLSPHGLTTRIVNILCAVPARAVVVAHEPGCLQKRPCDTLLLCG